MKKLVKWDYYIGDDSDDLVELGKQGWELISVVYKSWEDIREGGTDSITLLYFKRPLI